MLYLRQNGRRHAAGLGAAFGDDDYFCGNAERMCWSEQTGNPALSNMNINQSATATQSGGNMEGKEVRIGTGNSALWATATIGFKAVG